jgi:hypothetical protein
VKSSNGGIAGPLTVANGESKAGATCHRAAQEATGPRAKKRRRVGAGMTAELTGTFAAIGTRRVVEIGVIDSAFGDALESFRAQRRGSRGAPRALHRAAALGRGKGRDRARDEQIKPLSIYRSEELATSTSASSEPTAPTTRRAAGSSTSSPHRVRCP